MSARWALIAAARGSGKTALAARAVAALRARGLAVAGVLQEPLLDADGDRAGYRLARIGHADTCALARRGSEPAHPGEESFCSYLFDRDAFARAAAWLARDAPLADAVVVDEVSKLEVARRGHHDAVASLLAGRALAILSVRADQLFAVMERFALDEPIALLDASDAGAVDAFAARLASALRPAPSPPG